MSLDLEQQLIFYGSYHSNTVNVAIHMVCVPIILMTSFLLVSLLHNAIFDRVWARHLLRRLV